MDEPSTTPEPLYCSCGNYLVAPGTTMELDGIVHGEDSCEIAFMSTPVAIVNEFKLDLSNEFEATVAQIVAKFRTKNGNYAMGTDLFQGFIDIAADTGQLPLTVGETLQAKHRLSIRRYLVERNATEASDDGFLDRAVYSIINLCLYGREQKNRGS